MAELQEQIQRRTASESTPPAAVPQSDELTEKLTRAETLLTRSLAQSVALSLKSLHKPQSRSKSIAELVEWLLPRGAAHLQYMLEDLTLEMDAGNPLTSIPRLEDPTINPQETFKPEESTPSATTVTDAEMKKIGEEQQLFAGELDHEEDTLTIFELYQQERDRLNAPLA
jgi:hypothetical protein